MPNFNLCSTRVGKPVAALFEIRLDNDIVILRGVESEASSQLLRGVVVLCLAATLRVEDVSLQMTGKVKIGRQDRVVGTWIPSRKADRSREIFTHQWPSLVDRVDTGSTILSSGNYEWPFELVIDGTMAETIEGLTNSYITYTLEAVVTRGKTGYDLHASKPLRIFRTLGPAALELAHPMSVEGLWPEKIEYKVSIPRKGVVFGTEIVLHVGVTPLLKGLRVGAVRCILFEYQDFTLVDAVDEPGLQRVRVVDTWEFEPSSEESMEEPTLERVLPLPKRLSKCVPDVHVCGIKLRHRVRVDLDLHGPTGHISQLRITLPVTIFISPDMLPDATGYVVDTIDQRIAWLDSALHPPPPYGRHTLDRLQIYTSTIRSHSVMNTPIYRPDTDIATRTGGIHAAELSRRLQDLQDSRQTISELPNDPRGDPQFRSGNSCAGLGNGSRGSTTMGGNHQEALYCLPDPAASKTQYHDLDELSKVPSYNSAVQARIPATRSPATLPTYDSTI